MKKIKAIIYDYTLYKTCAVLKVHSVYNSTVNLEYNGNLITITDKKLMLPGTIIICPIAYSYKGVENIAISGFFRSGAEVRFLFPFIYGENVIIDLMEAKPWHETFINDIRPKYYLLPNATAHILQLMKKLIGFGKGLTPAGDDFLIGILSVIMYLYRVNPIDEIIEIVDIIKRELLFKLSKRTNFISLSFFKYLLEGRLGEPQIRFFDSLLLKNRKSLKTSIKDILSFGASSGYFILRGIFFCLEELICLEIS